MFEKNVLWSIITHAITDIRESVHPWQLSNVKILPQTGFSNVQQNTSNFDNILAKGEFELAHNANQITYYN